jgi:hypothetical protein
MNSHAVYKLLIIALTAAFSHSAACQVSSSSPGDGIPKTESPTRQKANVTPEQVATLLASEFGGLFKVDERNITPSYLVGDFNGDGVEDLAASVRLDRQISTDDKSKPPFSFEKAYGPGPSTLGEQSEENGFTMGDLARYHELPILAVIHGSTKDGWKNSQPEQRFVVVDAWHLGKKMMSLYHGRLKPASYGDEPRLIQPPQLLGDAILMLDKANAGTAVYWDGATYRWYPVAGLPDRS